MSRALLLWILASVWIVGAAASRVFVAADEEDLRSSPTRRLDPTAWGSDHVGKPWPEYVTGDECLFCHRKIGPSWPDNRHQLTVRSAEPADPSVAALPQTVAAEVKFIMGGERAVRFLKRSPDYGKLEMFSAKFVPLANRITTHVNSKETHWDANAFGDRCAGCHATAVESETRAFSATSIDCFACHGSVDLAHTNNPKLVLMSRENQKPREVISICGQCHLRGGTSKSTELPYPNTFVAGDNLFRDFSVDLSIDAIGEMSPVEAHIFENARDVVILGRTETTCLTCHSVHGQNSQKHQELEDNRSCSTCHVPGSNHAELNESFLKSRGPSAHSSVCEY